MYKGNTFIAIIPARGGSKGLPGKNIKDLCGKPLIAWSIESGLDSAYLDKVVVSTDCENIASIAKDYGAKVPFLRPAYLATDTATTFDVVKHVIEYYQDKEKVTYDFVVLLEPTSPLRDAGDIERMIEKVVENKGDIDSVVSIGEVHEHPSIMKKIVENKFLDNYCKDLEMKYRRQDSDSAYFPYGVAYIVNTDSFLNEKTFYTQKCGFYEIKRYQCYEIDDIYDFLAIESILNYKKQKDL
jgi:CMP-N,N'-diacetyllegionaminic acid synthase